MPKWRISWNSNPRKIKQTIQNDETGITLVELLAAISILSIVILLAGSVHMFGQRQFIDQTNSASQANDMSYAMTVMSKDIRKLNASEIQVERDKIVKGNEILYLFNSSELKKGGIILVQGVQGSFEMTSEADGVQVKLNNQGDTPSKQYETTIYFRR